MNDDAPPPAKALPQAYTAPSAKAADVAITEITPLVSRGVDLVATAASSSKHVHSS